MYVLCDIFKFQPFHNTKVKSENNKRATADREE